MSAKTIVENRIKELDRDKQRAAAEERKAGFFTEGWNDGLGIMFNVEVLANQISVEYDYMSTKFDCQWKRQYDDADMSYFSLDDFAGIEALLRVIVSKCDVVT